MPSQRVGELIAAGVVLSQGGEYGSSGPTYVFTRLNDLKPPMIAEATANARVRRRAVRARLGQRGQRHSPGQPGRVRDSSARPGAGHQRKQSASENRPGRVDGAIPAELSGSRFGCTA